MRERHQHNINMFSNVVSSEALPTEIWLYILEIAVNDFIVNELSPLFLINRFLNNLLHSSYLWYKKWKLYFHNYDDIYNPKWNFYSRFFHNMNFLYKNISKEQQDMVSYVIQGKNKELMNKFLMQNKKQQINLLNLEAARETLYIRAIKDNNQLLLDFFYQRIKDIYTTKPKFKKYLLIRIPISCGYHEYGASTLAEWAVYLRQSYDEYSYQMINLLENNLRLTRYYDDGEHDFSIISAAKLGAFSILKGLVDNNPLCLEFHDRRKKTPIIWAASKGHTEIVKFLIERNADLSARSVMHNIKSRDNNLTALDVALLNKHDDTATILLKANTPLSISAFSSVSTLSRLDYLLNYQQEMNTPENLTKILHLQIQAILEKCISTDEHDDQLKILDFLKNRGANLNQIILKADWVFEKNDGRSYCSYSKYDSLLHHAGYANKENLIKWLIKNDNTLLDLKTEKKGRTLLYFAMLNLNIHLAKYLIKKGANTNAIIDYAKKHQYLIDFFIENHQNLYFIIFIHKYYSLESNQINLFKKNAREVKKNCNHFIDYYHDHTFFKSKVSKNFVNKLENNVKLKTTTCAAAVEKTINKFLTKEFSNIKEGQYKKSKTTYLLFKYHLIESESSTVKNKSEKGKDMLYFQLKSCQ